MTTQILAPSTRFTTPSDGWTGTLEEHFRLAKDHAHFQVDQIASSMGLDTTDDNGAVLMSEYDVLNALAKRWGGGTYGVDSALYELTGDLGAHLA